MKKQTQGSNLLKLTQIVKTFQANERKSHPNMQQIVAKTNNSAVEKFRVQAEMLKQMRKTISLSKFSRIKHTKYINDKINSVNLQSSQKLSSRVKQQDIEQRMNPQEIKISPNLCIQQQKTQQIYSLNKENPIDLTPNQPTPNKSIHNISHPRLKSQLLFSKRYSSSTTNLSKNSYNLQSRYELRLSESKQKIMKNKIKLVESQTNFKLEKKIKQNINLRNKQSYLNQLILARVQYQRQKDKKLQTKRIEQRFVHQNKLIKIKIQRKFKNKCIKEEQNMIKKQVNQSQLNKVFNEYQKQQQDIKKQQNLLYNLSFLKNCSKQQSLLKIPSEPIHDNISNLTKSKMTQQSRISRIRQINN